MDFQGSANASWASGHEFIGVDLLVVPSPNAPTARRPVVLEPNEVRLVFAAVDLLPLVRTIGTLWRLGLVAVEAILHAGPGGGPG